MFNLLASLSSEDVRGKLALFNFFLVLFLFHHLDLLSLFVFKLIDFGGDIIGSEFRLVSESN